MVTLAKDLDVRNIACIVFPKLLCVNFSFSGSFQDVSHSFCLPIKLRLFVEELTADGVGEMSEIETAVVVDDVINQPPRFLQQK